MVCSSLTQGYVLDFYGIPKNTEKCLPGCAKRENRNGEVTKPVWRHKLELLCHSILMNYVRAMMSNRCLPFPQDLRHWMEENWLLELFVVTYTERTYITILEHPSRS